jgi:hypothetical protein
MSNATNTAPIMQAITEIASAIALAVVCSLLAVAVPIAAYLLLKGF